MGNQCFQSGDWVPFVVVGIVAGLALAVMLGGLWLSDRGRG